jgi:hypothetical protein
VKSSQILTLRSGTRIFEFSRQIFPSNFPRFFLLDYVDGASPENLEGSVVDLSRVASFEPAILKKVLTHHSPPICAE